MFTLAHFLLYTDGRLMVNADVTTLEEQGQVLGKAIVSDYQFPAGALTLMRRTPRS
jgi:hypothetical protein